MSQTKNLSLTLITLTVWLIYATVLNIKIKSSFNMTVFDGGPRCHVDTCFWHPNKNVVFGTPKASRFCNIIPTFIFQKKTKHFTTFLSEMKWRNGLGVRLRTAPVDLHPDNCRGGICRTRCTLAHRRAENASKNGCSRSLGIMWNTDKGRLLTKGGRKVERQQGEWRTRKEEQGRAEGRKEARKEWQGRKACQGRIISITQLLGSPPPPPPPSPQKVSY